MIPPSLVHRNGAECRRIMLFETDTFKEQGELKNLRWSDVMCVGRGAGGKETFKLRIINKEWLKLFDRD